RPRASQNGPRRSTAALASVMAALLLVSCTTWPARPEMLAPDATGPLSFAIDNGVTLTGDLALPAGSDKVGAVVLMHGCSGLPTRSVTVWRPLILSWGYATLAVDSFGGRGLRGVCANALALTGAHRVPDAYGALTLLARH